LFLSIVLLGCSSNSAEDHSNDPQNPPEAAPGYQQLYTEIFSTSCASGACHDGEQGIAGLSFAEMDSSYEQLVGTPPSSAHAQNAGMLRVSPGDPDASFLLAKLEWSQTQLLEAGFGAPMPMGGVPGPGPSSMEAIRKWIEAGAPKEGADFEADTADPKDDQYISCDSTDDAGLKDCFPPAPNTEDVMRLYTPKMEIPAASESLICSPLTLDIDTDILLKGAQGLQMEGGHHIAVYVRDGHVEEEPHECTDTDMLTLRFVVGAGGAGAASTQLPPGTALRVQAGQQIVIQSHYINTAADARVVMDAVELLTVDPDTEPAIADALVIHHADFTVPPLAVDHEAVNECTIEEDLDVHLLLGHTHDFGVFLQLEHIQEGGETTVLYTGYDGPLMRDDPEITLYGDPPLQINAGDKLRITCRWTNPGSVPLGFPEEMCVAFMYYTPGQGFLICDAGDGVPSLIDGGDTQEEGCMEPGTPGNAVGVGEYCTPDGGQCADNEGANFCLATFDPASNFCSIVFCTTDEQCGEGATCYQDEMGSACVPLECL